jgi:4a-hydroxytetrahydrobiopterin dehydratase
MTQVEELRGERCEACNAKSPHVTAEEIAIMHPLVPEWQIRVEDGIRKLERTYTLKDFVEAAKFTVMVGDMAEEEQHHPRIVTEWGLVRVAWWTHKIFDMHRNDFIMASKTDMAFQKLTGGA